MALSITSKILIGVTSTVTLGGLGYGAYSQLSKTSDVKEALIKKNKTPLDLTTTSGDDFEHWQELVNQHKTEKPAGKAKIADLNLTDGNEVKQLKDKCKVLLETKEDHPDFEKNLKDAENWCTNENAPRKVSKLLDQRNKVLLKDDSVENWTEQWNAFKGKYQKEDPKGNWTIEGWTGLRGGSDAKELKKKCVANGAMSLMLGETTFLDEIEKYCSKEKPKQ